MNNVDRLAILGFLIAVTVLGCIVEKDIEVRMPPVTPSETSQSRLLKDREVLAIDSITGKKYVVVKNVDDRWPLTNPDTKADTLWPSWICDEERVLFPYKPNVLVTSCPFCGSRRVAGATINEKDLEVRMPPVASSEASELALLRDMEVLAIDSITGKKYVIVKKVDDRWPLTNPDTKVDTLWSAWVCHDEQILFPGRPGIMITGCRFCGSGSVGGATVNEKDLEVKMVQE